MKHIYSLILLLVFATIPFLAQAQVNTAAGSTGLGVIIGDPTGVSLKHWNSGKQAYDIGLAWSFRDTEAISLHGDFLWHTWIEVEKGRLAFFYGVGARALFMENDSGIGVRIPVGLSYLPKETPLELFFELAPIVEIIPDTEATGNGGIGVRYYF